MKLLLTSLKATTLLVFGGIMVLTIGAYLNLPLPLKPLVVKTGSMAPSVPAGSLVLVTKKSNDAEGINYVEDEIITFKSGKELVSHRVFSVFHKDGVKYFQTKGDANKTLDSTLVSEKDVVGKVTLSVPYIGRFVDFVKNPLGFFLLIIIPTLLIIISEVIAVWEELKKKPAKESNLDFAKPFAMFFLAAIFMGSSHAFFSDVATSTGNTFQAVASFCNSTEGHVVVNEVFYDVDTVHNGTGSENDWEWVELYNPTSSPVSLTGWSIADGNSSDAFPGTPIIPACGFAIVSPSTGAELEDQTNDGGNWTIPDGTVFITLSTAIGNGFANGGDSVILKNNSSAVVDAMSYGTDTGQLNPSVPDVASGHSLERNPDGFDTNAASDFVDRTTPTPGS